MVLECSSERGTEEAEADCSEGERAEEQNRGVERTQSRL